MIMAKIRGLIVMFAIIGAAAVFGWSAETVKTITVIVFGIGGIFLIISLLSKISGR